MTRFRPHYVALAAVLAGGGFSLALGGPAAAEPAPQPIAASDADLKGLAEAARDEAARRQSLRESTAASASTAADPEDCLTTEAGQVNVTRFTGADRYDTAVCVSYRAWFDHDDPEAPEEFKADAVVLARGDLFPDALAGGPLAAQVEGPLLLTPSTALHPDVKTEIQRALAPGGPVYLLGGTSALSDNIKTELESAGYVVRRLAGADRFETAIAVAEEMPDTSNFFFATGMNFPDALAAGTAAASLTYGARVDDDPETRPFALLLTHDTVMPAVTGNFAVERGNQFGVWTLVTAGFQADQAAEDAFGGQNLVARFVGANRYETATAVAEGVFTDTAGILVGTGAGLATGMNFPDALAATSLLPYVAEPLLLTRGDQLSPATRVFLESHAGDAAGVFLDVFGGTAVISEETKNAAKAAFTPDGR